VVKAFNAIRMEHYDKGPKFHDGQRVIFVSGDDKDASAVVIGLVNDFGYAPVGLGGLVSGGRSKRVVRLLATTGSSHRTARYANQYRVVSEEQWWLDARLSL
jgi:predicted dinucleotide-binding enzyme